MLAGSASRNSREARTASLRVLPKVTATAQASATAPNASSHSQAGASDRPEEGGEVARKIPMPLATSAQPAQSRRLIGRRDHHAASGIANSRSVATIGATSASG